MDNERKAMSGSSNAPGLRSQKVVSASLKYSDLTESNFSEVVDQLAAELSPSDVSSAHIHVSVEFSDLIENRLRSLRSMAQARSFPTKGQVDVDQLIGMLRSCTKEIEQIRSRIAVEFEFLFRYWRQSSSPENEWLLAMANLLRARAFSVARLVRQLHHNNEPLLVWYSLLGSAGATWNPSLIHGLAPVCDRFGGASKIAFWSDADLVLAQGVTYRIFVPRELEAKPGQERSFSTIVPQIIAETDVLDSQTANLIHTVWDLSKYKGMRVGPVMRDEIFVFADDFETCSDLSEIRRKMGRVIIDYFRSKGRFKFSELSRLSSRVLTIDDLRNELLRQGVAEEFG